MESDMKKSWLSGFLIGLLVALGLSAGATDNAQRPGANLTQTFNGALGISTSSSADGRTITISPSASQTVSGTTYTFGSGDCGREKTFTNAAAVVATIPATLPVDCNIAVLQAGAGTVSVNGTAVAAAVLHSNGGFTHTAAQWSVVTINVYTNPGGSAAVAVIAGDGA
jgi:hypothetical protein